MGRRGPPPQPTKIRELHGNAGKRALNKSEPIAVAGDVTRPRWLKGRTRAASIWSDLSERLRDMKVLTPADEVGLALLCAEVADYIDCRDQVRSEGRTYESVRYSTEEVVDEGAGEDAEPDKIQVVRKIMRAHPLLATMAAKRTFIRGMMQEFGLTPSARSRIATDPALGDDDGFEKFLQGGAQSA